MFTKHLLAQACQIPIHVTWATSRFFRILPAQETNAWMIRIVSPSTNGPVPQAIGFGLNTRTGRFTCLSHRPSECGRKATQQSFATECREQFAGPGPEYGRWRKGLEFAIVYCIYFTRVLDGTHHHHGEQPTLARTASVLHLNSSPVTTHFTVLLSS